MEIVFRFLCIKGVIKFFIQLLCIKPSVFIHDFRVNICYHFSFGVTCISLNRLNIAMCHFELTMQELGVPGCWIIREPALAKPDRHTEYVASWAGR